MAKTGVIATVTFLLGGFAGTGITYYFVRKKYIEKADAEIASVKESLTAHYEELLGGSTPKKPQVKSKKKAENEEHPVENKLIDKSSISDSHTTEAEYQDYSKQYRTESVERKRKAADVVAKEVVANNKNIYVLTPEEYSSSDLSTSTLYYYQDGIVTDDDGRVIDDYTNAIGNCLTSGDFDGDTMYVRNEKLERDFEIIFMNSTYTKVAMSSKIVDGDD